MTKIEDYQSDAENQWCPGCSNFGILQALKLALVELGKSPHEVCLVSGIGQAAKLPHYLKCNFFNGLHGRAVPVALGIHVTHPELTTIVTTGDGDCYGEGGNHFLHALRRNPDITVMVHNNEIYALTKGQASPTTPLAEKRTLQIRGVDIVPLNMPAAAILQGCSFVARGFAGEVDHLKDLIAMAIRHRGFSYLDVVQPCITWGSHPMRWYRDRVFQLGHDYDKHDRELALHTAMAASEKIPIGILYEGKSPKTFGWRFRETVTAGPLTAVELPTKQQIETVLAEFKKA